jgi:hypothetical protein
MNANDTDDTNDRDQDGTIREPDNSTVEDWLGQKVERDRALAERLLSETGDFDEARRRFEQEREGPRPESLPTEERRT